MLVAVFLCTVGRRAWPAFTLENGPPSNAPAEHVLAFGVLVARARKAFDGSRSTVDVVE